MVKKYLFEFRLHDFYLNCLRNIQVNTCDANIDDVAIFSRALSITEVQSAYNSGAGKFSDTSVAPWNTGLVGLWRMDDGTGTSVTDFSGNGYTGTLSGTTYSWITGKVPTS